MSFILDALRKSENERQREAAPSLSRAPIAAARRATPAWTWLVIGLLSLALVALATAWWRSGPAAGRTSGTFPESTGSDSAPRGQSRSATAGAGVPSEAPGESAASEAPAASEASDAPPQAITSLADIDPGLSAFGLEFFSFNAADPAEGFAWINGTRYAPGERIGGGPEIVAIRRDGVLLSQDGRTFLLKPR